MPRVCKSIAELELTGTLKKNKNRYKKKIEANAIMETVQTFPPDTKIECPKSITDKAVKDFWQSYTSFAVGIQIIKPQDLVMFESLCHDLQNLRDITRQLNKLDITNPENTAVDVLLKRKSKIENSYTQKAMKFYISPADRSKLVLDSLDITKKQQETKSAIDRIISNAE